MRNQQLVNFLRLTPLAIAMGVLVAGCDSVTPSTENRVHPDRVHPVKAFTVPETPQIDERSYPLVTRASHLSELAFRRSGEVIELPVTEGRRVKKGELLARLDPSDHERRLSKRLAELQLAERNFARAENLVKQQAVSESEYQLARAEARVAAAEVELARQALKYTELRAPRDGVVSQVFIERQENVQTGQPIVALHDHDQLELELQVSEQLLASLMQVEQVAGGSSYSVQLDSLPGHSFEANYKEHETEIDLETGAYRLVLQMTQSDELSVLPGMNGAVFFDPLHFTQQNLAGTVLPSRAVEVRYGDGDSAEAFVWVIDQTSKTVSQRSVKTGMLSRHGIVIHQGVAPGDIVVTDGQHNLYPQAPVSVIGGLANQPLNSQSPDQQAQESARP